MARKARTAHFGVTVLDEEGRPLSDAQVALVRDSGHITYATWRSGGRYECTAPEGTVGTVWVAHERHPGHVEVDVEVARDLEVRLAAFSGTRSTILTGSTGSTGHVPGIAGRFNPQVGRGADLFVYIDNATANGQPAAPHHLRLGQEFEVEDENGDLTPVTCLGLVQDGSLINYR